MMYITVSNAVQNLRLLAEIPMCSISSFRPRRDTSSRSRAVFVIKTEMPPIKSLYDSRHSYVLPQYYSYQGPELCSSSPRSSSLGSYQRRS